MHFSVHELNIWKAIQTNHLKLRCKTANTYQFESMDNFNLLQSNSLINVRISGCGFSSFAERTQTILYVCCRDGKKSREQMGMENVKHLAKNWIPQNEQWILYIANHNDQRPCHRKSGIHFHTFWPSTLLCGKVVHVQTAKQSPDADLFLKSSGGKRKVITGDGNCFYQSLPYILYSYQDSHGHIRG